MLLGVPKTLVVRARVDNGIVSALGWSALDCFGRPKTMVVDGEVDDGMPILA